MRNILISLAVAGAAVAAPASAQYVPAQPYGYNNDGYGGYGFNNYGQVRTLHARIDRAEQQIDRLERFNAIPPGMADRLRDEARRLEYRLSNAARNGFNPYEINDIRSRVGQFEQRIRYFSANRYRRNDDGYNRYNGYDHQNGQGHWDADRDNGDRDD